MNCHNNQEHNTNEEMDQSKKHSHKKHMLLMVLCCAIPIALLLILPLLNLPEGNFSSILSYGIFLLCPLLHIVMMMGMMKHSKGRKEDQ